MMEAKEDCLTCGGEGVVKRRYYKPPPEYMPNTALNGENVCKYEPCPECNP
jgi:hypothetical protein